MINANHMPRTISMDTETTVKHDGVPIEVQNSAPRVPGGQARAPADLGHRWNSQWV